MEQETRGYNLKISLNNFEMCYDDVGEGAVPIIFLHGYPFDKTMWQAQLEFLKSSQRSIAIDIRGFGKSRDEKSPLSIDKFVDDLIQFMDKLRIDRAKLCGLSMGGYIALSAMKRFPARFQALILCDTQCNADSSEAKEKRYKAIEEIEAQGAEKFNEGFIKKVFHKDSIANKKQIVERTKGVVFSTSQHTMIQGLVALAERSETCSSLEKINIPTLIICGREDELTPPAQSEFMHGAIKGSKLRIIDHAGHVSNLEQADEFNKHISEFLRSLKG